MTAWMLPSLVYELNGTHTVSKTNQIWNYCFSISKGYKIAIPWESRAAVLQIQTQEFLGEFPSNSFVFLGVEQRGIVLKGKIFKLKKDSLVKLSDALKQNSL